MIYGYGQIVSDFKKLVDEKRLAHAYLFYGEPQVGKFAIARALARYCEEGKFEEEESVLQETLILDVALAQKEGGEQEEQTKESMGVESIHQAQHFLYQTATKSFYRVVIIRDAEWLTREAQNALLKTLEEPPEHGVLILTAQDPSVLLPTVSSRLQRIHIGIRPQEEILDFLIKYAKISPSEARALAEKARGRVGRALSLMDKNKAYAQAEKLSELFVKTSRGPLDAKTLAGDAFDFINKKPAHYDIFFETLLEALITHRVNATKIKAVCDAIASLGSLALNKRLVIKKILWTLQSST